MIFTWSFLSFHDIPDLGKYGFSRSASFGSFWLVLDRLGVSFGLLLGRFGLFRQFWVLLACLEWFGLVLGLLSARFGLLRSLVQVIVLAHFRSLFDPLWLVLGGIYSLQVSFWLVLGDFARFWSPFASFSVVLACLGLVLLVLGLFLPRFGLFQLVFRLVLACFGSLWVVT